VLDCAIVCILLIIEHNGYVSSENYNTDSLQFSDHLIKKEVLKTYRTLK